MLDPNDPNFQKKANSGFDDGFKGPSLQRRGIASNLSDESFDIFVRLMTDKRDLISGLYDIQDLLPKKLNDEFGAIAINYNSDVKSYQRLGWKTTSDLLFDLNTEYARTVQAKIDDAIEILCEGSKRINNLFDLPRDELEGKETSILMRLQAAKSILQFFISDESIPHETNICITVGALNKPNEEALREDLLADLTRFGLKHIIEQPEFIQQRVSAQTGLSFEQSYFYTSLSPQFIRSLISTIDEIRALAISNSILSSCSFDDLINDLGNSSLLGRSKPHITQQGYDIIIDWRGSHFPFVSKVGTEARKRFYKDMEPLENLLDEFGGEISYKFDQSTGLKIIIHCPPVSDTTHLMHFFSKQRNASEAELNYPEDNNVISFDEELKIGEPFIYLYTKGRAEIDPAVPFIKASCLHEDGSGRSFDVMIDQQTFFDKRTLAIAQNFLNFAKGLNSNHSISEIFIRQDDLSGETNTTAEIIFNSKSVGGRYDPDSKASLAFRYNAKGNLISSSVDNADRESW